jgi:hypothetical protein
LLILLVSTLKKGLFGFFEFFSSCRGNTKVPVEVIVVDEVWSDGFEVHKHIIKLLEDEEALSHALPSWNGITL